jgi:hypothetical protein
MDTLRRTMKPNRLLVSTCLLLAACGDNLDRAAQPDASSTGDAPPAPPRAVVVSGDFVTPGFTGVMSALDLQAMQVTERVAPNGAIGNDPVLRKINDELFVVNRAGGNNVTILDAHTFTVKEQLGTGAGSNPQDVATFGSKLFIPAFGTKGVVVATRGSTATSTIDLSALDPDGEPNCISAFAVDGLVYVACELLDQNFAPRGPGQVVVIDGTDESVRTTFALQNENPFGMFERMPLATGSKDLVIPSVTFGTFATGCVERIATGGSPGSRGCIVTNQALAGFVTRIEMQIAAGTPMLWMVVGNGQFGAGARSSLMGFDLETNTLWMQPVTPPNQLLVDVAACPNGALVVADQTMTSNGLRVYENGLEKTTLPLAIGMKPNSSRGLVCY